MVHDPAFAIPWAVCGCAVGVVAVSVSTAVAVTSGLVATSASTIVGARSGEWSMLASKRVSESLSASASNSSLSVPASDLHFVTITR